jgi:hypothetical protein
MASETTTVISFDVDGTLLRSRGDANRLHKKAFSHRHAKCWMPRAPA